MYSSRAFESGFARFEEKLANQSEKVIAKIIYKGRETNEKKVSSFVQPDYVGSGNLPK